MATELDHGVLNIFPFPVKGSSVETVGGVCGIGSGLTEVGAQYVSGPPHGELVAGGSRVFEIPFTAE
jgi:hypothetical protein